MVKNLTNISAYATKLTQSYLKNIANINCELVSSPVSDNIELIKISGKLNWYFEIVWVGDKDNKCTSIKNDNYLNGKIIIYNDLKWPEDFNDYPCDNINIFIPIDKIKLYMDVKDSVSLNRAFPYEGTKGYDSYFHDFLKLIYYIKNNSYLAYYYFCLMRSTSSIPSLSKEDKNHIKESKKRIKLLKNSKKFQTKASKKIMRKIKKYFFPLYVYPQFHEVNNVDNMNYILTAKGCSEHGNGLYRLWGEKNQDYENKCGAKIIELEDKLRCKARKKGLLYYQEIDNYIVLR